MVPMMAQMKDIMAQLNARGKLLRAMPPSMQVKSEVHLKWKYSAGTSLEIQHMKQLQKY